MYDTCKPYLSSILGSIPSEHEFRSISFNKTKLAAIDQKDDADLKIPCHGFTFVVNASIMSFGFLYQLV